MKQQDIIQFSTNDLREKLKEEKGVLIKLKLNHAVSPIENPMKIKSYRKTIARLQTELSKRIAQEQNL